MSILGLVKRLDDREADMVSLRRGGMWSESWDDGKRGGSEILVHDEI